MEKMKLIANNASCSLDHASQDNKISDKDGKRETEKKILREQLLASWLGRKQLEEEVIKDMMLQWGKKFMPSNNLEATNESSNKPRNGRILSKEQNRELEKRIIGEELLSSWLNRKQLEEEVITELFREDTMLQRGKNSIASDCPEITSDACNKPLMDLQKCIHMQYKGENSALVLDVQGPISLNGQDWNNQSPGNHADGELTGSLSIQCPSRPPNKTEPGMIIGLDKGAMTPLVSSVKECTSPREDKVGTLLIGGAAGTTGKMITKRKHWECDLCNVSTNTESVLRKHFKGKKHLAKLNASSRSRTATSLTFDQEKYEKAISSDNKRVLGGST